MRKIAYFELLLVLHVILLCSHMMRNIDYVMRTAPLSEHCSLCSP